MEEGKDAFIMDAPILLVEDEQNDVLFTTMALKRAGVTNPIYVVRDGREALAYFSSTGEFSNRQEYPLPYLVLLDLKLPYVMGLEVLKWLRARPEFDCTVVIVLTASTQIEDMQTAYHLGANAFLVKPSGMDKLEVMAQAIKDFWLTQNQMVSHFSQSAENGQASQATG
jgi:CheY-like chemotaxis protein